MRSTHNNARQDEVLISLDIEIDRNFRKRLRGQRNMINGAKNGVANKVNDQQDPPPEKIDQIHKEP